jgi:hypothetical protein
LTVAESPELEKGIAISLLACYPVSTILLVIAQLGDLISAKGWTLIAIQVIANFWFGTYLAGKVPHEGSD